MGIVWILLATFGSGAQVEYKTVGVTEKKKDALAMRDRLLETDKTITEIRILKSKMVEDA